MLPGAGKRDAGRVANEEETGEGEAEGQTLSSGVAKAVIKGGRTLPESLGKEGWSSLLWALMSADGTALECLHYAYYARKHNSAHPNELPILTKLYCARLSKRYMCVTNGSEVNMIIVGKALP
ncbi:hypothetical protein NDU88_005567 [Pleurodeles waltl]|uniref:Uncharacterized protein n=1 Tax=Pleurodeles waltl TaxID=8319 RepID=A0AAV7NQM8_PLEWA|nr:hypothetical protein NDU88_005567 [Pleurodeles waltl]